MTPEASRRGGLGLLALFREFAPRVRQAFVVPPHRRMAISEPLAFIGAREVFVEASAVLLGT